MLVSRRVSGYMQYSMAPSCSYVSEKVNSIDESMIELLQKHHQSFGWSFFAWENTLSSSVVHRQQRACRHRVRAICLWPPRSVFNEGDELSENRIWWFCDKNQYHMWQPKTFWDFRRGCFGARLNFNLHYLQAMCSVASAPNIANERPKKKDLQPAQS